MQHHGARGQTVFLVLAVVVLFNEVPPHIASAQGTEEEVLEAKAWAALDRGDPRDAAQLFELAYDRRLRSSCLYGLARAHDQLGKVQAAYEFYLMYLASLEADPVKQRLARERVDELAPLYQRLKQTPVPDVTAFPKPPLQLQCPKYPCTDLQKILSLTTNEPNVPLASEALPRRRFQPIAIPVVSLGATGAGAIAAGFGMARLARSEQLAFSRSFDEDFKRRAYARGQALTVASITLYAAGSALILASATWLPIRLRRAVRRDISLVPLLSPQALGGEISWIF